MDDLEGELIIKVNYDNKTFQIITRVDMGL